MKNKPYVLLVGVDFSELADCALREAFSQASQRTNAEVHVLSVLPVVGEDPGYAISVYAALDERPLLDTAIQRLRLHAELQLEMFRLTHSDARLGFRVVSHVLIDTAAHGIVELASVLGADLILIGTHNPKGIERLLLGSVAEATVRNARCPVLVIPPVQPDTQVALAPPVPSACRSAPRAPARLSGAHSTANDTGDDTHIINPIASAVTPTFRSSSGDVLPASMSAPRRSPRWHLRACSREICAVRTQLRHGSIDLTGPRTRDPKAALGSRRSDLSTIALTDPPQIGQTDPVIGTGARGAVGRVLVGAADRPSGSTRLSG